VACVVVMLAAGCSDDDDLEGEAVETSTTADASSPSDTTSTTAPACPEVGRQPTSEVEQQQADVDGDGLTDVVQVVPIDGQPDRYRLLVDLAAGGGATTDITGIPDVPVALLGAEVLDAQPDSPELIWVRVGAGASTTILGLYALDGCDLEAVTFASGERVELPIGGTVGTASGARCGSLNDPEGDLLVTEATYVSGQEYEVVTKEYRWEDGQLVPAPGDAPSVDRTTDLSEVGGFRCGELSL
jgi:hypothetical protein